MADRKYAHEAAAYMDLHEHRKENSIIDAFVPKFYGTFPSFTPEGTGI